MGAELGWYAANSTNNLTVLDVNVGNEISGTGTVDGIRVDYTGLTTYTTTAEHAGIKVLGNGGAPSSSYGLWVNENWGSQIALGSTPSSFVTVTGEGTGGAQVEWTTAQGPDDTTAMTLQLISGAGGNSVGAAGGQGGSILLESGAGGDGSVSFTAGGGGDLTIVTGAGGYDAGEGGGNGGILTLRAGAATGGESDGSIQIEAGGDTAPGNAGYLNVGVPGVDMDVSGPVSVDATGSLSLLGGSAASLGASDAGANTEILAGTAGSRGQVIVGDSSDTSFNSVVIYDGGGTDLAAELVLYDESGYPYVLWVDSSGKLRIESASTKTSDSSGSIVGSQS